MSIVSNEDLLADLAIPGPKALHSCCSIHAAFHLAKDHMLAIHPLSLGSDDEKLATVVLGPALAMDKMLGPVCCRMPFQNITVIYVWIALDISF